MLKNAHAAVVEDSSIFRSRTEEGVTNVRDVVQWIFMEVDAGCGTYSGIERTYSGYRRAKAVSNSWYNGSVEQCRDFCDNSLNLTLGILEQ